MEEEGYFHHPNKVWNFLHSIVFEPGEGFFFQEIEDILK